MAIEDGPDGIWVVDAKTGAKIRQVFPSQISIYVNDTEVFKYMDNNEPLLKEQNNSIIQYNSTTGMDREKYSSKFSIFLDKIKNYLR